MVRLVHMASPRMNRSAQLARQRGFTLIEVMVAMAVFMFGLLSLLFMQSSVIQSVRVANELALATNIATAQLEEMELLPLIQLAEGSAFYDYAGAVTTEDESPYYTLTWTVEGTANLRDVTMTATWTYNGEDERTVTMVTQFWEEQ